MFIKDGVIKRVIEFVNYKQQNRNAAKFNSIYFSDSNFF